MRVANSHNNVSKFDSDHDEFDRPPDLSLPKGNSSRHSSKKAVEDALIPCLADCKVNPGHWKLEGKAPQGRFFTVKFLFSPLSATRAAQAALGNLRDSDGKWKSIKAQLVNNDNEKLHIGLDENDKAKTKRKMAACVKKATGESYPDVPNVHFKRTKRRSMLT